MDQNNLQEAIDNQFEGRNVVVSRNDDRTFIVSCLDTLKDYTITENEVKQSIDWNEAMENAVAPESQNEERNEGVIGVGTDGKPVDMDLWEYTLLEDGTYGLNDAETYNTSSKNAGYIGEYTENGEIIGKIPQYISIDNGNNFIKVTSLYHTFRDCSQLVKVPIIPSTVYDMRATFTNCDGIVEIAFLPHSVILADAIFQLCDNLAIVENLPDTITNLSGAFAHDINLKYVYNIPNNVVDLRYAFDGCTSLINVLDAIPELVENMTGTFRDCHNLTGTIKINAQPTSYSTCFSRTASQTETLKIMGNNKTLLQNILDESNDYNVEII